MNWARGLLRLWLLGSGLFLVGQVIEWWPIVRDEFTKAAQMKEFDEFLLIVPIDCRQARGKFMDDYQGSENGPWLDYGDIKLCWYEEPKFRKLYPEYASLTRRELGDKLYAEAGQPTKTPHPWTRLGEAIVYSFGPPLGLLLMGFALLWVGRGFRRRST